MSRSLGDVLEAIRAGAVVVDRSGAIEELNSVACRLLEHSRESVLGRPVEALVEPQHALARIARKVMASGFAISEFEQQIEQRGGGRSVVDVAASPLFGEADTAPAAGAVPTIRTTSGTSRRSTRITARRSIQVWDS